MKTLLMQGLSGIISARFAGRACLLVSCLDIATASAVAPPPVQVTADCENTTYASDFLVCEDTILMELDRLLALQIANGAGLPPGTADPENGTEWETHEDWFRRSRMCAFQTDHRDCLIDAYCERIGLLDRTAVESPSEMEVPNPVAPDVCTVE